MGAFGEMIRKARTDKGWTIKEFIDRVMSVASRDKLSPAFITRVEQYGDIPSPDLICAMAATLGLNIEAMLKLAKEDKVEKVEDNLEKKYREAAGNFRKARGKE